MSGLRFVLDGCDVENTRHIAVVFGILYIEHIGNFEYLAMWVPGWADV